MLVTHVSNTNNVHKIFCLRKAIDAGNHPENSCIREVPANYLRNSTLH